MKHLLILLLVFFFKFDNCSAQQPGQSPSPLSSELKDKTYLINYYKATFDTLQKKVDGLSAAQLNFKPSAEKWSLAQCLEHIILTEKMLFNFAKEAMEKPANPDKRKDIKSTDEDILKGITDRSYKAKAQDELTGKGKYSNSSIALIDLKKERVPILEYINKVSVEDLRNHVSDSPFGPIDAYQSLLFVAGHTARHTLQIEEVKASQNFPKK